jgi:hypothetical protein
MSSEAVQIREPTKTMDLKKEPPFHRLPSFFRQKTPFGKYIRALAGSWAKKISYLISF